MLERAESDAKARVRLTVKYIHDEMGQNGYRYEYSCAVCRCHRVLWIRAPMILVRFKRDSKRPCTCCPQVRLYFAVNRIESL